MNKYKWKKEIMVFICLLPFVLAGIFFIYSRAQAQTDSITAIVKVSVCGDNIAEGSENCDGSALDGQTCLSLGFDGGTLGCDPGCVFNTSECVTLEPEETNGSVIFSGKSYPVSAVIILKDGQSAAVTATDVNGNFETTLPNISVGIYTFSIYAYDNNSKPSGLLNYRVEISGGEIEEVAGITITPTISADKSEVEKGKNITFFGQSVPRSRVVIYLVSDEGEEISVETVSGADGLYSYQFDTDLIEQADYEAGARTFVSDSRFSARSGAVDFEVGEESESAVTVRCGGIADLNNDCHVNLIDFSILIYWFGHDHPIGKVDLDNDKRVSLTDFSILMYHWTG